MTIDERVAILEREIGTLKELKKLLSKIEDSDMRERMEKAAMTANAARPVIESATDKAAAYLLATGNKPMTIGELAEALNVKPLQLRMLYQHNRDSSRFTKTRNGDGRVAFCVKQEQVAEAV